MSIAEKLQTIAQNEQRVYNAGYEKGKSDGGDTETAYNQGLEEGKQAEYDRFWDNYQQNGKRTDYTNAFSGNGWNENTLKPKYDVIPIQTVNMFRGNVMEVNISDFLKEQGVKLDFSKATVLSETLLYSSITGVGVVDARNAANLNYAFSRSTGLETIRLLILKDNGSQTFSTNTFIACPNLKNITIQGVIGQNFYIQDSPLLTIESMKSIINALKNYSGTSYELTYAVSFPSGCWDKLEASGTAPNGDTWRDYVTYELGWNT